MFGFNDLKLLFRIVADFFSVHLLCNWLVGSVLGIPTTSGSLPGCNEEWGRCTGRGLFILFQRLPRSTQTLGSAAPAPQRARSSVVDWPEGRVPLSLWLAKSTTEPTLVAPSIAIGSPFACEHRSTAAPRLAETSDHEVCKL